MEIITRQSLIDRDKFYRGQAHGKRQSTCAHCQGSGMMKSIRSVPSVVEIRKCTVCFGKGAITSLSRKMKR